MRTLFENAFVIDGSSCKGRSGNVAVEGSVIACVSSSPVDRSSFDTVIDASGRILCPGFMDIHAHSELEVLRNPPMSRKVQQGITFDLSGNCGIGVYPKKPEERGLYADILGHSSDWGWTDFRSFASHVHSGINMGFLQSHSCLRNQAIPGNPNREADSGEIAVMCSLLDDSLSQGCFGLSTGLYYAPCIFASEEEMLALLDVVKRHNALFCVHHRCEGDEILESLDELFRYVRKTGVRLEISHLKAIGRKNQRKVPEILRRIHQLRDEGFDVAFDQYPYEYGSTSLFSLLPPDLLRLTPDELSRTLALALSDKALHDSIVDQMKHPVGWDSIAELCPWEDIRIVVMESCPDFNGLSMVEAAGKLGMDCFDALFHLLSKERGCALMTDVTQTTDSLRMIFSDPLMSFGSDALYAGAMAHPRSANAAIHLLCERCKKDGVPFEDAINRMTGRVATRLGIKDRGFIKEGFKADLVVFDPVALRDNSDSSKPFEMCTGLEHVMVNGMFALDSGKPTGSTSGNVILS